MDVISHSGEAFEFSSQIQSIISTSVKECFDAQQVSGCKYFISVGNHKGKNGIIQIFTHIAAVLLVQVKHQPLFLERDHLKGRGL